MKYEQLSRYHFMLFLYIAKERTKQSAAGSPASLHIIGDSGLSVDVNVNVKGCSSLCGPVMTVMSW